MRYGFLSSKALQYFLEVARQGSITGASTSLRIAQPAVTRQMHLLEEDLGVKLLVRHGRGVELTEAGALLRDRVELLLNISNQCRDEVSFRNAEPRGRIRFGLLPSLSHLLVGHVLARYLAKFPLVTFALHEGFSDDLRRRLLDGEFDLAIMSIEMDHPDLYASPLFAEDLWLSSRPADWRFGTKPLHPRQLQGLPLMHASFLRAPLNRAAVQHGLKLTHVVEGEAMTAIRAAARSGVGYMVSPRSALELDLRSGEFVGAPIVGLEVVRALFRRLDRPPSHALLEFITVIRALVAELKAVDRPTIRDVKAAR